MVNDCGYKLTIKISSRRPATYMTDLDFADDIALIASSIANMQKLILRLKKSTFSVSKNEFIKN